MRKSYGYKLKFFAFNGAGPWLCFFCARLVVIDWETFTGDYTIHHINGDHDDNHVENLTIVHAGCHSRHHASTDDRVAKMVARRDHEPWLASLRAAGKKHADNILTCDDCGRTFRGAGQLKRHQSTRVNCRRTS